MLPAGVLMLLRLSAKRDLLHEYFPALVFALIIPAETLLPSPKYQTPRVTMDVGVLHIFGTFWDHNGPWHRVLPGCIQWCIQGV